MKLTQKMKSPICPQTPLSTVIIPSKITLLLISFISFSSVSLLNQYNVLFVTGFTPNALTLRAGRPRYPVCITATREDAKIDLPPSLMVEHDRVEDIEEVGNEGSSFASRMTNSGVAAGAAAVTAAVNAAVSMKTLSAPDVTKSYISLNEDDDAVLDEDGLPLVYDRVAIEAYWLKEKGALNDRWGVFVGKAVPFFTRLITLFVKDGSIKEEYIPDLSRRARIDLQDLGPTFIKAGQMMSVRPDVLPPSTLEELSKLQDSVIPFSTPIAVKQIEKELGGPLGQFFTSISEEPVAAASLAQVYLATLADGNNTQVAIKVQRPDVLTTVSKDLYVLRRAAEVFQGLVERFAPQQRTNYVGLLNEWAIGFYTELDFKNEASNQERLRILLKKYNIKGVTVPKVFDDLCTRRLLVSEWMDGVKLSDCTTEEIAAITPVCQEAFLTQLFEEGFFHADPHPGNILKLNQPTEDGHTVALIDCGLMASIDPVDRDNMISAVIHLANKDYASLVDDFMTLKILPPDCDRAAVIPLMDKALSPYVKGGGAKKYEAEVKRLYGMEDGNVGSQVGGFQAMTQDALTVLNDIPFSIPPYFAILGRAIVTLEGVALTGDPDYGLIMESYPFIARKLLREDRPEIQRALQEVLYSSPSSSAKGDGSALKFNRLLTLLNNAAGSVSTKEGAAFVDIDAVPEDGLSPTDGLSFLLSDSAESLRNLLGKEADGAIDVVFRRIVRKGFEGLMIALAPPRPPSIPIFGDIFPRLPSSLLPKIDDIPLPFLLPEIGSSFSTALPSTPSIALMTLREFADVIAPSLTRDEEIYAKGLEDAAGEFYGENAADLVGGNVKTSDAVDLARILLGAAKNGALADSSSVKDLGGAMQTLLNGVISPSPDGISQSWQDFVSGLDEKQRSRLDIILSGSLERGVNQMIERLSGIGRIL